ncbi:MAG TPA: hypothetical protein PLR99_03510 [Polyangiaceae bacterium]|nr:hypothetical protein [Polyangiaceae bacterium]
MKRPFVVLALVASWPIFGAGYLACSSATPEATDAAPPPTATATTLPTTPPTGTSTTPPVDAAAPVDAAPPDGAVLDAGTPPVDAAEAGCAFPAPVMDGGGLCGTYPFGAPAVTFVFPDAGAPAYDGGVPPPGTYDVVLGERASSLSAGWRETLVLDGARFTSVQQRSVGGTDFAVRRRAGTYAIVGGDLTFTYDCGYSDDVEDVPGSTPDTYPFTVTTDGCDRALRWSASGTIHLTLKRRP